HLPNGVVLQQPNDAIEKRINELRNFSWFRITDDDVSVVDGLLDLALLDHEYDLTRRHRNSGDQGAARVVNNAIAAVRMQQMSDNSKRGSDLLPGFMKR